MSTITTITTATTTITTSTTITTTSTIITTTTTITYLYLFSVIVNTDDCNFLFVCLFNYTKML